MARSPEVVLAVAVAVLDELEPLAALGPPVEAGAPLVDELDEDEPHAAMNAASPVAAAPVPILAPAIFRNFLRSTSSRASASTAPICGLRSSVVSDIDIGSPCRG